MNRLPPMHGKLRIGFRNPKNEDKDALLVPLLNPAEIIKKGARAKFGDPLLLNLGGLGVRDMVACERWFPDHCRGFR